MSLAIMPKEIKLIILGNLDHKNLCTMQALSREWHIVASEDSLWQDLFSNKYPTEPLPTNGQAQKKFRAIMTPLPLKDKEHLHNAITTFFCNLKWNKKREFICSFPNEPSFSLKAAQSFGPERGTEAEFERPTDE